jgi:hypothetical protein
MHNQSSIARCSLFFASGGNLGHDFIMVIGTVKANTLWKDLYDMKPRPAPDDCEHEFRGLNRLTRRVGRRFSWAKSYAFMIRIEVKPGLIQRQNIMPNLFPLRLKDPEERSGVGDPTLLVPLRQEMQDPAKIGDYKAKALS